MFDVVCSNNDMCSCTFSQLTGREHGPDNAYDNNELNGMGFNAISNLDCGSSTCYVGLFSLAYVLYRGTISSTLELASGTTRRNLTRIDPPASSFLLLLTKNLSSRSAVSVYREHIVLLMEGTKRTDYFCSAQKFARTVRSVYRWLGTDFASVVSSWRWAETELLSGVVVRRSVAVLERVDWSNSNPTSMTLRHGMHLLVVFHLGIINQTVVVISSVAELATAVVAATSATAAAKVTRQPRAGHLGALTKNEAARMENIPKQNCQPHWCRLQNVQDGLIAGKSVAGSQTRGELNKAIDDTNGDGQQASVERPD
jgi:hypothetical protein